MRDSSVKKRGSRKDRKGKIAKAAKENFVNEEVRK
jgi:hypothetical protein